MAATTTTFKLVATGMIGTTALTGFAFDMPAKTKETVKEFFKNFLAENATMLAANTTSDEPAVKVAITVKAGTTNVLKYEASVLTANQAAATTAFNTLLADTKTDITAIGGTAA